MPLAAKELLRRDIANTRTAAFYVARAFGIWPLIVSVLPVVVTWPAPEPALFFVRFVKDKDDFDKHPIGWTASWSSRGSPRYS